MKNFKLILMVALVLVFSSITAFAADDWVSQLKSGLTGLSQGDFVGVAAGVGNFAMTSIPGVSQTVGAAQWTNQQLLNIRTDLGTSFTNNGLLGVGSYAVKAPFSGLSKIADYGASKIATSSYGTGNYKNLSAQASLGKASAPGTGSWIPKPTAQKVESLKVRKIVSDTRLPVKIQ